jgi:hypothetical protein
MFRDERTMRRVRTRRVCLQSVRWKREAAGNLVRGRAASARTSAGGGGTVAQAGRERAGEEDEEDEDALSTPSALDDSDTMEPT